MKDFIAKFRGAQLDKKQIAIGMHLCYMNAIALMDESRLLKENGHHARAFSLAILALEELGEIPLILNTVLYRADDDNAWQKFWRLFNLHQTKLKVWSTYGKLFLRVLNRDYETEFPAGVEPLLDKLKQLGFYVNFFSDQFVFPEDFAKDNPEWIDWLFAVVDERIASFKPLHGSLEDSERLTGRAIELLTVTREAKSPDELKRILSEWISQHSVQDVPNVLDSGGITPNSRTK